MSEQNVATSRRFFDLPVQEVITIIDQVMSPDFVYHTVGADMDRALYKQVNQALAAAFPDLRFVIEDIADAGDKVWTRWSMTGTHQGEFNGIPATGKAVALTGVSIDRYSAGRIVECWQFYDALGFMQQLGVIPA